MDVPLLIAKMDKKQSVKDDDCLPSNDEIVTEEKVWLDTWDLEPGDKFYVREDYGSKEKKSVPRWYAVICNNILYSETSWLMRLINGIELYLVCWISGVISLFRDSFLYDILNISIFQPIK